MNLSAIREDLATALESFDFNVYSNVLTSPELPALVVGLPQRIEYSGMRDTTITLPIHVLISMGDSDDAQLRMSLALTNRGSVESVLDAVRTATSLYWKAIQVVEVSNFGLLPDAGDALSCEIVVQLLATNFEPVGS